MERVFLAGTTTGTTWRIELCKRLVARGVHPERIINPHLPPGVAYTHEHMRAESLYKKDPDTIVLIYICPAVIDTRHLDPEAAIDKIERLGPISMLEIGRFVYSQPHRTAVVLDYEKFQRGRRPRQVLEGISYEIADDFHGQPPFFSSLYTAEDWVVSTLSAT